MDSMEGSGSERRMDARRSSEDRRSMFDRRVDNVSALFYYDTRFSAERRFGERRMGARRHSLA